MSQPAAPNRTRNTGDLILLAVLAGLVAFYGIDAVRASTDIRNLILVLPLSVVLLTLCVTQFVITVRERRAGGAAAGTHGPVDASGIAPETRGTAEAGSTPETGSGSPSSLAAVLRVVGLFAAYVLTLPWLGFDVGTCLFLAAFLFLHGERRWLWLGCYSLGFGLLTAFFFSRMLPYPMPMLLLGSA